MSEEFLFWGSVAVIVAPIAVGVILAAVFYIAQRNKRGP